MTAKNFIKKWRYIRNHHGLPAVGIHVDWEKIPLKSEVDTFRGKKAWEKLYICTPPWFESPKTFKQLAGNKDVDYLQIAEEETKNRKIECYRKNGLQDTSFCAFTNHKGSFILLGDGNHRFFDCLYLIGEENQRFDEDIKRKELDVIYLSNFDEVMRWAYSFRKSVDLVFNSGLSFTNFSLM